MVYFLQALNTAEQIFEVAELHGLICEVLTVLKTQKLANWPGRLSNTITIVLIRHGLELFAVPSSPEDLPHLFLELAHHAFILTEPITMPSV